MHAAKGLRHPAACACRSLLCAAWQCVPTFAPPALPHVMQVTGNSSLASLSVSGSTILSNLNTSDAATLASLTVTGGTSLAALSTSSAATLASLVVTGSSLLGATTINRTSEGPALTLDAATGSLALLTAHPVTISGQLTASGGLDARGGATVLGSTTIEGGSTQQLQVSCRAAPGGGWFGAWQLMHDVWYFASPRALLRWTSCKRHIEAARADQHGLPAVVPYLCRRRGGP